MAGQYNIEPEELDRRIDAALAKYGAVEPRDGLAQRIMAAIKAEPAKSPQPVWWKFGLAAGLALVLLVLGLAWRSGPWKHSAVARQRSVQQDVSSSQESIASEPTQTNSVAHLAQHRKTPRTLRVHSVAAAHPKLDQFPSPQPLTEQEKLLARYVAQFHRQAVLLARVANEELQRDRVEMIDRPESQASSGEPAHDGNTHR
jgi:hypothetical protein